MLTHAMRLHMQCMVHLVIRRLHYWIRVVQLFELVTWLSFTHVHACGNQLACLMTLVSYPLANSSDECMHLPHTGGTMLAGQLDVTLWAALGSSLANLATGNCCCVKLTVFVFWHS